MMDTCRMCGKPLGYNDVIYAAEGALYCSKGCCQKDTDNFEDVSEEVVPSSIGILPPRKYTITGVDRNGKRFAPIHTDTPQHFNIWNGTIWRNLPNGRREKIKDVIN